MPPKRGQLRGLLHKAERGETGMLACFGCGRNGRFDPLEPSPAPSAARPSSAGRSSFNEMQKDPSSLVAEVKTHLRMAYSAHSMDLGSSTEDITFRKSADTLPVHAEERESAPPPSGYGHREEKEHLAISATVVKHDTTRNACSAKEGKDENNIRESISSLNSSVKSRICSKEKQEKGLRNSIVGDGFIDKELHRNEAERGKIVTCPTHREELVKKAISEEATSCVMHAACDTDSRRFSTKSDYDVVGMSRETMDAQDGKGKGGAINVADKDYQGYYDKGVISKSKVEQPKALFSYGISDQQRDFLFLCAGLVIQAVGFQLRSIVEVVTALILLCYRSYIFAWRFTDMLSCARQKFAETCTLLFSQVAVVDGAQIALVRERWEYLKPFLIQGAKKMGWGCLNAVYVLGVLCGLLLTSFLFSYIAVRGGSTQQPIHVERELYFDYTKAHPAASLDLFSLDAYRRMANASKGTKASFSAGLRYRCTILLILPESDHNRKLGIFQVTSELLSDKGEVVEQGSQPSMLMFKSNTVHWMKGIVMAIPTLTGMALETQTLKLQLLEWHHNASAHVLQIMLVPRAGSTALPQLYKAHIYIDSIHSLLIASSSSIFHTLFMWLLLSFLIFGCLLSFCMYTMHRKS